MPPSRLERRPKSAAASPGFSRRACEASPRGSFIWVLLVNRAPHLLGVFMAAASIIPLGDAVIVLRSGGTRAVALGIHGATAAAALAASAALLVA